MEKSGYMLGHYADTDENHVLKISITNDLFRRREFTNTERFSDGTI